MTFDQLCTVLDQLEPGMSLTVPQDWFSLHVEGDETERDMATLNAALERQCTWERHPETQSLTFSKQAADQPQ